MPPTSTRPQRASLPLFFNRVFGRATVLLIRRHGSDRARRKRPSAAPDASLRTQRPSRGRRGGGVFMSGVQAPSSDAMFIAKLSETTGDGAKAPRARPTVRGKF